MNVVEAFILYKSLNLHFKSNYDFFKYKNPPKQITNQWMRLNDGQRSVFRRLSEHREPKMYTIGNFLFGNPSYVTNFQEDPYLEYRKFITNGEYIFKNEIGNLKKPFKDNFIVDKGGDIPHILKAYVAGDVSLFTACTFRHLFNWTERYQNNFLIQDEVKKIDKSYKFFRVNTLNIKQILLNN